MAKNLLYSTGAVDQEAADHKAAYDGHFLDIYDNSAGIPTAAEDAVLGNKLVRISLNGLGVSGLTYEATPAEGVLNLDGSAYSGLGLVAADMAYARLVASGDGGGSSSTDVRTQYTVGASADFDITVGNVAVSIGVAVTFGSLPFTASKNGG